MERVQRNILRKKTNKSIILYKCFWSVSEILTALSTLHSTSSEEHFSKKNSIKFNNYFELWAKTKLSEFEQNLLDEMLRLYSKYPEQQFGKEFFFSFSCFFGLLAWSFRTLCEKFSSGLWKLHSTCPGKNFEEMIPLPWFSRKIKHYKGLFFRFMWLEKI